MERPLTSRELQVYEHRLLEMRSALADEVERIEEQTLAPSGDLRFQRSDGAVEESVLGDQLDGLAVEDVLGYAVHRALDRIKAGTYGLCASCRRTIARERLDLLPYAVECAECAKKRSEPG